jgi:hypothetical protein
VSNASSAATSAVSPNRSFSDAALSPARRSYPLSNVCAAEKRAGRARHPEKSKLGRLTVRGFLLIRCFSRSHQNQPQFIWVRQLFAACTLDPI